MRFKQARENIENMQMQNQIRLIYGDALNILQTRPEEALFDLILIDAAKGHYQNFFKLASPYLAKNGVIISDNVLFKGRSEEHTSELQSRFDLVCRLLLEKTKVHCPGPILTG